MHITLIKKNLIGKFQNKIYLRLYYFSLRNSIFLSDYDCFPLNVLERKGKRCYFRFCCKFFCLKCPLPNYMLEKPPGSYNEVFSVRAKSVKNGLTYVNSRNAFSSMFIITTLSVGGDKILIVKSFIFQIKMPNHRKGIENLVLQLK